MNLLHLFSLLLATARSVQAIVGGAEATKGHIPFIVALARTSFYCAGTLVGSQHVLTAAHCVHGISMSSMKVRLDSLRHASGGTQISISAIAVHSQYNATTLENDVAVLTLTKSYTGIAPAQLPSNDHTPEKGSSVRIAGWGMTLDGGSYTATLRTTSENIVGSKDCHAAYKGVLTVTEDDICAGVTAGGKGACSFDDGGPVIDSNNTLIGIISRRKRCALPGYPDIDARVGAYLDWISSQMA
jgi:trypsin